MKPVIVGMADCKVASAADAVLVTYALGSCVAVSLYDPVVQVGGMLHFMLPDSNLDPLKAQSNPFMFADTGIPQLVEAFRANGAQTRRAVVRLAGGAQVLDSQGVFQIGKRNYLEARRILWKSGILVSAEAVGGEVSRTTRLEIANGRMWIREGGGIEKELLERRSAPGNGFGRELGYGVFRTDRR